MILKSVVHITLYIPFYRAREVQKHLYLPRPRVSCLPSSKRVFCRFRNLSSLVMWSSFMLMSGKLSEKRLPDVAGYHTAMEVGRTSHSLPPFGFPRLRFSQSQRYFCLFLYRSAISLGIQWMSVSTSVERAYGRETCRQTYVPRNGDIDYRRSMRNRRVLRIWLNYFHLLLPFSLMINVLRLWYIE